MRHAAFRLSLLLGLGSLSLGVGCKPSEIMVSVCEPACAVGFHCVDSMCAVDPDHDAGAPDGPAMGTCTPACAAPTPFCSVGGRCVVCLEDKDCSKKPNRYCKATVDAPEARCSGTFDPRVRSGTRTRGVQGQPD